MNIPEDKRTWFDFCSAIREMELGNLVQNGNGDLFRSSSGLIQTKTKSEIIAGTTKWKGISQLSSLTSMKFTIGKEVPLIKREETLKTNGIKQLMFKSISISQIWRCSDRLAKLFNGKRIWFIYRLVQLWYNKKTLLWRNLGDSHLTYAVLNELDSIARLCNIEVDLKLIDTPYTVLNKDRWKLIHEFMETTTIHEVNHTIHLLLYQYNK